MDFLDTARIRIRSGSGGPGCVSFRREKNVPFGGPDGGDGGDGGDVWAVAVSSAGTLMAYRRRRHVSADSGGSGARRNRTGAAGSSQTLELPVGTVLTDDTSGTEIGDLSELGARLLIARGGRGGSGNARFATSTDRAPRRTTPAEAGVERMVAMRLKLLADAGLVGLPNAGKSTFLRATSNARPKVADYPFTTLHPHLGMVERDHEAFLIADIPGLIEGAHAGAGLGDQFLGHIERCAVLLHLVDGTVGDVVASYRTIEKELSAYGEGLAQKPRIVRLSKSDALSEEEVETKLAQLRAEGVVDVSALSALSGRGGPGIQDTLQSLWYGVRTAREVQA